MDVWRTPHVTLAYFALIMTFVSLWVKRSPWIWGGFLLISFVLAYFAGIVAPIALAPIGGLLVVQALIKSDIKGFMRLLLVLVAIALSVGLMFHYFPGFKSWIVAKNLRLSPGAIPYTFALNFDKPFIGLFVLAWSFPLIENAKGFEKMFKATLPLTLVGVVILACLAFFSGLVKWDPKWPAIIWLFLPINLFFVCIPEEAFMRGFIQRELFGWFGGKGMLANSGSVLVTAFAFATAHYFWISSLPFLGLVFVAGIIYGAIYQYTKSIEAAILCHWVFNITHILLFTYPALKSGMNLS
jgi:hypothetical protein